MKIESKDISVIVQGHVKGLSTEPYENRWTYLSLESIRKYLPDSEIILSTFKGCDVEDLSCDVLIQSDDPGHLDLGEMNIMLRNTNRQIVSTRAGLNRATRKFVLKMRYDLVLGGIEFLGYFDVFNERMDTWNILKKRVLSCSSVSINPRKLWITPFAPSDWFHFGLLDDVQNLWDIPLIPEPEVIEPCIDETEKAFKYLETHYYTAEQYLWVCFLRKYGEINFSHANDLSDNSIDLTDQTIVNNIVILEPEQISLRCLKYRDKNFLTYSKRINYSHSEWLFLYEKYCLGKYFPRSNECDGIRYSAIFDNDKEHSNSNDYLLETSYEVIRNSHTIDFSPLGERLDEDRKILINSWPGENFKLLASLVRYVNPNIVVEFGMGDALTTLCMRQFMKQHSFLVSINYNFCNWEGGGNSLLTEKDFENGAIIELELDISLPVNLEKVMPTVSDADIIIFNLEDGLLLGKILNELHRMKQNHDTLFVIDNIRLWSIVQVWDEISMPKLDITSFGNHKGVGLVLNQV